MNAANITIKLIYKLFKEYFNIDNLIDVIYVIDINTKEYTRYKHHFGINPIYLNHLRI